MIKGRTNGQPIVGAGRVFWEPPLILPHGGFGTFYNKEAIRNMVSPMICPDQAEEQGTSCANLQENRIGELDVYQPGDSLFDLFYKFSALQQFCMHSDWVMGYLITYYLLPGKVSILEATGNSITHCTENSMTCHWQTPSDMERLNSVSSLLDSASILDFPHIPLISSSVSFGTCPVVLLLITCLSHSLYVVPTVFVGYQNCSIRWKG